MATFADLVTLLITFFVLLLSMSSLDAKAMEDTFGFFDAKLGALEMYDGPGATQTNVVVPNPPVLATTNPDAKHSEDPKELQRLNHAPREIPGETANKPIERSADFDGTVANLREDLKTQKVDDLMDNGAGTTTREQFERVIQIMSRPEYEFLKVVKRSDRLQILFAGDLLFHEGRVLIRTESYHMLRQVGDLLRRLGVRARVIGVVPPPGAARPVRSDLYTSGWDLAIARGCNVVRFLSQRAAVAPQRLSCAVIQQSELDDGVAAGVVFELRVDDQ